MKEESNAVCIVCGKSYHCCLSCKSQTSFKPWRTITDSVEHYKIHLILSDYHNGHIDKMEARQKLQRIDFEIDTLKPGIRDSIHDILGEETHEMIR